MEALPEELVSEILCRTSPLDASRFAVISKLFKSIADSESVWDRFLPSDWPEIASRSVSPAVYATKKELCISLCRSPIFLAAGTLTFSLENMSGKKCYMLGARELLCSNLGQIWQNSQGSRFQEVLNCLGSSHGFDIRGRIKARMLSPNTTYAAYLVYKVGGRGLFALSAVVRAVDNESDNDAENRCAVVHVIRPSARYQSRQHLINATLPVMRYDGWSEIELGSFWNDPGHQPHAAQGMPS